MEKLELHLKRNQEYRMSVWEISRFLMKLNSSFYKNSLLNELRTAFSDGIRPEDVFIMDSSFKAENINDKLERIELNSASEMMQLVYIGKPIFLYPSAENVQLFEIFSIVEKIRNRINQFGYSKRNTDWILSELLNGIDFESIDKHQEIIKSEILMEIKKKRESDIDKADSILSDIFEKSKANLKDYEKNYIAIEEVKKSLSNHTEVKNKKLKDYFNKFEYYFNKVSRPLIYIVDRKAGTCSLLVEGQVNKKKADENFVQLIEYKKINPDFVSIGVSLIGVPLVTKLLNNSSQKLVDEHIRESIELTKKKQQTEILEQEKLKAEIEQLKLSNQASRDGRKINNSYLKHQLMLLEKKQEDKVAELQKTYKFEITDFKRIDRTI
ncbi:hypothetical protein [Paenibacillus camerounensis]|uniref:hypothetical protein n=1 Tax=Paenibacillus camerounensis TaxID=1243663 RepID=UPI0012F8C1D7|nr:hypothetical protein [Paenibacillus camerounensis]